LSEYETEESGEESDDDILECARERYEQCDEVDTANRIAAIDDLNFLKGGENQWDAAAVQARRAAGRPIITVNSLPTYLHQVTNDQRMNTPAIKVHPVGSGSDVERAKVRQGMIRHIEYDSNADVAYDTAVNSAAAIGFGYFGIVTDFESPTSFDQKLMFRRIRNAMSVRIDPLSVEPDGSDMKWCFVEIRMDKKEFKRLYPDAKICGVGVDGESSYANWVTDDEVVVCDYYCIVCTPAKVVFLSNGESGYEEDLLSMPTGVSIVKSRDGEKRKTMLYKITGADVLEKTEIKCKWIPVFPVYGDELDIEGEVTRSGIIRHAKGPAMMYNVFMTSATEEVGARSKTPYIGAEGQFAGHEAEWANANDIFPYREYKPVTLDGNLAPPPQRAPMADIPAGWMMLANHAGDNIKKTTGLFDASLGARGTATSGVQEKAQQAEGDMANFHYADGLLRTIRHAGRCLNDMIPAYYDRARTVAIMSEDNVASSADINQPRANGIENDMTVGEYGITVTAGASYSTLRQENQEFFTRAMQSAKDPATAAVVTYLAMKNSDAPGQDEATAMLKALLPPQVLSAIPGDKQEPIVNTPQGPLPLPQAEQAIAQMSEQLQGMQEALKKADIGKQQIDQMKQQQAINDQQLEPQRMQTEQMRIAAEVEKARATAATAEASKMAAQAEMMKAQNEANLMPHTQAMDASKAETERMTAQVGLLHQAEQLKLAGQKLDVEGAKAQADSLAAQADSEKVRLEVAQIMKEMQQAKPSGMTVKAPSGQVYDVKLNS
jgi:hypothetical protein